MNEMKLKKSWEINTKSTQDDWKVWLRTFSIQLIRQTPSSALRACIPLANQDQSIAFELFNPAFLSCWTEMSPQSQKDLVQTLETVLSSAATPEVLQVLLNLTEFMDRDEKPLPINPRILATLAEDNHAYAKALRYNEAIYRRNPHLAIESLVNVNQQLGLPDAAKGLVPGKNNQSASLYVKLQDWSTALSIYEKDRGLYEKNTPHYQNATLGMIKCYDLMGNWEQLAKETKEMWPTASSSSKISVAAGAAAAAWRLGEWGLLNTYIQVLERSNPRSIPASFYKTLLCIHDASYDLAQQYIDFTRECIDTELTSLLGESYLRSYHLIVIAQQLAELEESIIFQTDPKKRNHIKEIWDKRLRGADRSISTWRSILSVRSLTLTPQEDQANWIKFASLCRKNGRKDISKKTLVELLGVSKPV